MADAGSLSIVLAGGGVRTFWSMGVLHALQNTLPPANHFAGVSAGAAMAMVQVSGRVLLAREHFIEATARNRSNFEPRQLLAGKTPFPHTEMMRAALRFVFADGGFRRVRTGPPIHILASYLGPRQPPVRTSLAALRAFEQRARLGELHGPHTPTAGLGMQVMNSRSAMDPEQLIDWVERSSSTPPVTPVPRQAGRRYLDGALIDNVPIRALPSAARAGRVLALLCRPQSVSPRPVPTAEGGSVLYLAPREEPAVSMWDFTSPEGLRATWDQGVRDGEALRERVLDLLR